jgi:SAM-dependent methyltransferase
MLDKKVREETIKDFNNQWKILGVLNKDYWASDEILIDQFDNIFNTENVKDKVIGDVGAGTGRVVRTLLKYNPSKYYAIEPSKAGIKKIAKEFENSNNLKIVNSDGANFQLDEKCDYIFSLGVIHHIKNPVDVLTNIRKHLKENGKIIIWVYGHENNLFYITIYKILSIFTKYLPDRLLYLICNVLNFFLLPYIFL